MANEVSTYMTNGTANIKEDIGDAIYSISPEDTVFMNMIKKGTATNRKVEWMEDADRAPATNAKPEEWDGTASAVTLPVRKENYTQHFADGFSVTDSMQAVDKVGRSDEIGRLAEKALRQVAKDVEFASLNNTAAPSGHIAGTGGVMKGALGFVTTNTYDFGGTTTNACDLTETLFLDGLQAVWSAGGSPTHVIAPAQVARTISGFSGNAKAVFNSDASDKKIVQGYTYYESNFGLVKVVLSRWLAPKDVSTVKYDYMLIVDPKRWELAWLRKIKMEKQAKRGTVTPVIVSGEASLKCYNEAANYKISNISRV